MKKEFEKQEWIINYLKERKDTPYGQINVLDKYFVDQYIERFNPKYKPTMYGADKCSELGRLLSKMYYCNMLRRYRIGLSNMESGFPRWVYVYELK